jgi:hypothetical protein
LRGAAAAGEAAIEGRLTTKTRFCEPVAGVRVGMRLGLDLAPPR